MELSQRLKADAISKNLCQEHIDGWDKDGVFDLMEYYKANPDWCLERKYPSIEFLKENFNSVSVRNQGVYIGWGGGGGDLVLATPDGAPVFIFNQCSGRVRIPEWMVARVYVALGSNLEFIVGKNAILILDYYDDSRIQIHNHSHRKCLIHKYSPNVPVIKCGRAIIHNRHGRKTV